MHVRNGHTNRKANGISSTVPDEMHRVVSSSDRALKKRMARPILAGSAASAIAISLLAPVAATALCLEAGSATANIPRYASDSTAAKIVETVSGQEVELQPDPMEANASSSNAEDAAEANGDGSIVADVLTFVGIIPDDGSNVHSTAGAGAGVEDASSGVANEGSSDDGANGGVNAGGVDGSSSDGIDVVFDRGNGNGSGNGEATEGEAAEEEPAEEILHGIDVSEHNGKIDWETVKASGEVDFAIIRCGYGRDVVEQDDERFEYNVSECERLGIPYGVYIYSYATSTDVASSEADHVLRLLEGHAPSLPVYYDLEERDAAATGKDNLAAMAKTFCDKIEEAGYTPGVYANKHWWSKYLTDPVFDGWEKWVAQYNDECTYDGEYGMWQYTDMGGADGVHSSGLDMNVLYAHITPIEKEAPETESDKTIGADRLDSNENGVKTMVTENSINNVNDIPAEK